MYEEALEKRQRHMELVEKRILSQGLDGEHPAPTKDHSRNDQAVRTVPQNFEM